MSLFLVVKGAVKVHYVTIEIYKLLDTPNQILIRGKILGDHIFDALEYFWQTNKYNEIGWFLLIALDSRDEYCFGEKSQMEATRTLSF